MGLSRSTLETVLNNLQQNFHNENCWLIINPVVNSKFSILAREGGLCLYRQTLEGGDFGPQKLG
jgi:hypothetical protein